MNIKNKIALAVLSCATFSVMANEYVVRGLVDPALSLQQDAVDEIYSYSDWQNIGDPTDCDEWSPLSGTVNFGQSFDQGRHCQQWMSREITITSTNDPEGRVEVETGMFSIEGEQEAIGEMSGFDIAITGDDEGSLEYQNNAKATLSIADSLDSSVSVEWKASSNLILTQSGNGASVSADSESGTASVQYRLTHGSGLVSDWSASSDLTLVNDWVDTDLLVGNTYSKKKSTLTSKQYSSNFTMETWVKPSIAIKTGTTVANGYPTCVGCSDENYALFPDRDADAQTHAIGLSVGTNGIKVYSHAINYVPPLFVSYRSISSSSWNHIALSVNNNVVSVYLNGQKIGTGVKPYTGVLTSTVSMGNENAWGGFYGKLAETRLWDDGLSASEISSLYERHLPLSYKTSSNATLQALAK